MLDSSDIIHIGHYLPSSTMNQPPFVTVYRIAFTDGNVLPESSCQPLGWRANQVTWLISPQKFCTVVHRYNVGWSPGFIIPWFYCLLLLLLAFLGIWEVFGHGLIPSERCWSLIRCSAPRIWPIDLATIGQFFRSETVETQRLVNLQYLRREATRKGWWFRARWRKLEPPANHWHGAIMWANMPQVVWVFE